MGTGEATARRNTDPRAGTGASVEAPLLGPSEFMNLLCSSELLLRHMLFARFTHEGSHHSKLLQ
jgi:hypothetical protein